MHNQHRLNQQQYHEKSESYLNSTVHAQGAEFAKMLKVCEHYPAAKVLDLGCGGGHVSYQLASQVDAIIAYDLSAEMVQLVATQAKERALHNVQTQAGAAEQLSFSDQSFDVVVSRYSAHHWQNIQQALAEVHRVLKPEGRAVFFDVLGSSDPILDTFLQCIEMIRDPSHVRNYSMAEWLAMVEYHGFQVEIIEKQSLVLDFDAWVARMRTPTVAIHTIRNIQDKVSDHVRRYYQIQPDGRFTSPTLYLQLTKI